MTFFFNRAKMNSILFIPIFNILLTWNIAVFRFMQFQAACHFSWLSCSKATQNDKQLTCFCFKFSDVQPWDDGSELCILALQVQSLCLRGRINMEKDFGNFPLTDSPKLSHLLPPALLSCSRPNAEILPMMASGQCTHLQLISPSFPAPMELGSRLGLAWLPLPLSF